MLPIFDNYRKMLNDTCGLDLSQYNDNKLWIDRMIIRGFNLQGEEVKICRLKVTDDLEYTYKFYDKSYSNDELLTYEQVYLLFEDTIRERERESIFVTKQMLEKYPNHQIILTTSMGKDSKLTEHILRKVTTNYRTIFNNTTLDCADVYKEVKARKDIEIVTPKMSDGTNRSFYKMIRKHGTPSRFSRWCCSYFKEGAVNQQFKGINDLLYILGMRNEESSTRSGYEFEWISPQWINNTWVGCLPIRKWTGLELWLYTIHNNIPINPKYTKGYQRVGCSIACPYYTKSTWILDKYWYKKSYDRFHDIITKDFTTNEKWVIMNCTCNEYLMAWNGGQIRKQPTQEVIKEFMEYKGLDDENLAKQYFEKTCEDCGKKVYKKDEVAMNLKLFGREITKFKCRKCLMKDMNWTKEQWQEQVNKFKEQGCSLF